MITTKKIYKIAFIALRKKSRKLSAHYSLKNALLEFGPTGYPFEVFVSKLLKTQGYNVEVGQIIQGKCVTHEVDVVAILTINVVVTVESHPLLVVNTSVYVPDVV